VSFKINRTWALAKNVGKRTERKQLGERKNEIGRGIIRERRFVVTSRGKK